MALFLCWSYPPVVTSSLQMVGLGRLPHHYISRLCKSNLKSVESLSMEAPAWSLVHWHQSSPMANCHTTTIKWAAPAWYQRKVSVKSCLSQCRRWASCHHNWRWLLPKRIILYRQLATPPLVMANTNEKPPSSAAHHAATAGTRNAVQGK